VATGESGLTRILLVQPFLGRREKAIFPIGLHALACHLLARCPGMEVRLLDLAVAPDPQRALERALGELEPQLVGLSLRNIDTTNRRDPFCYYARLPSLLARVRRAAPGAALVIGGTGFSMHAETIMSRHGEIDFGVFLEGEETLRELASRPGRPETIPGLFYRDDNGRVRFSGPRPPLDLATVPPRTRALLDLSPYRGYGAFGVEYQRGCSLTCDYCCYPFLGGGRPRCRPPEVVVAEMDYFHREHGVELFHLTDPVLNVPRERAERLCRALIEARLPVRWIGWFNERHLDEELADLALDAGCAEFVFSPDGYGDRALRELRKGIRQEDIRRSLRLARRRKAMKVSYNFIANPPGETAATFLGLLLFRLWAGLLLRRRLIAFFINHVRLEPGTGLYRRALREGLLSVEDDLLPREDTLPGKLFYRNPGTRWTLHAFDGLRRVKRAGRRLLGRRGD
jgi:anaerobic magnesium-protoporphyrin IX monomethyl ester cyclase